MLSNITKIKNRPWDSEKPGSFSCDKKAEKCRNGNKAKGGL